MDDLTLQQLVKSGYRDPQVTEVFFDISIALSMGLNAISCSTVGFDIVWDRIMLNFLLKNFRDGISLAERQAEENGIKIRLVVEVTKENAASFGLFKHHEIRHVNNIRSNFAIFDNVAYMVQIFHNAEEPPSQMLFSNSKALVESQQSLFNSLWDIATPLHDRIKEIEYQDRLNYNRILTKQDEIGDEICLLVGHSRKDLLVFSSVDIVEKVTKGSMFLDSIKLALERGATIRILVDGFDRGLVEKINAINKFNRQNPIQMEYTDKLGNFSEMVLVSNGSHVLQVKHVQENNNLIASFSNEQHSVFIQEIMFEKYWNEVKGLYAFLNNDI
jgi:hypothetical protein